MSGGTINGIRRVNPRARRAWQRAMQRLVAPPGPARWCIA
jgi:hypothetical protein